MADQRERQANVVEALTIMMDGYMRGIWTALPAIVQAYYPGGGGTVDIQPSIQGGFRDQFGVATDVSLPLLTGVGVSFPGGGGFSINFPLAVGDEGWVIFSARSIDNWFNKGGVQPQNDPGRAFNLKDGTFIPGARSKPRALSPAASSTNLEVRNDANTAAITMTPSGAVTVKVPTTGNVLIETSDASTQIQVVEGAVNITVPSGPGLVTITGNLVVTGTVNGVTIG